MMRNQGVCPSSASTSGKSHRLCCCWLQVESAMDPSPGTPDTGQLPSPWSGHASHDDDFGLLAEPCSNTPNPRPHTDRFLQCMDHVAPLLPAQARGPDNPAPLLVHTAQPHSALPSMGTAQLR